MAARSTDLLQQIRRLARAQQTPAASDADLLTRFVHTGDEDAFAALVQRYGPLVLSVCRRVLADAHAAEDAAQATWLVLARKAGQVRPAGRLAAWLHGVARRVAQTVLRAERRRRQRETRSAAHGPTAAVSDPLQEITVRELLLIIDEELARLPETQRLAVLLCLLEGKSQEEVARQLGWTPGAVKGRLERGRARLQARLVRRGLTLSAALASIEVSRLPAASLSATVRAALAFAGRQANQTGLASPTAQLAEAILRGMARGKIKFVAVLFLLCGLLAAGTGLAARQAQRAAPMQSRDQAPATPVQRPRLDHDGFPLPVGALARLGTMHYRSGYVLRQVMFSPGGRRIAVASIGNGIDVFDAATGRPRWKPSLYGGVGAAFSPDGRLVAVPGPRFSICLLDAQTGQERRRFQVHNRPVCALAFSPDGRLLASSSLDRTIVLTDVTTGKAVRSLKGHTDAVGRLTFSPVGRRLASVSADGTVRLWDTATGLERRTWLFAKDADAWCPDAAFTPDERFVIPPALRGVRLSDARTGTDIRTIAQTFGPVRALALTSDGKTLALGNKDGQIALWTVDGDKELRHWQAGAAAIQSLAFAPDGKSLVSAALWETVIRRWDCTSGHEFRPCAGHRGMISLLAFTSDGRTLISTSRDRAVCTWDVRTGAATGHFDAPGHGPAGFSITADRQKVGMRGAADPVVRLFATKGGHLLRTLPGSPPTSTYLWALALSPDGRLLAAGGYGVPPVLQDALTGKEIHRLGHARMVWNITFAPNGKLVAVADGRCTGAGVLATRLYDVATGRQLHEFDPGYPAIALAFSPDSRLLAVGEHDHRGVCVWDVITGKQVQRLAGSEGSCYAAAFSPDGRLLAAGGSGATCPVHVWELASGGEARSFTGHRNGVTALAFAPDGQTLASGGNDPILLWDLTGRTSGNVPRIRTPADLDACWSDLARASPDRALDAVFALTDAPALTVPFLSEHLKRAQALDQHHFARLVADLDSPRFRARERATAELIELGGSIEPATRQRLKGQLSAEARRRLERAFASVTRGPHWLREVRALEVLEDIGTPEARQVLQHLAKGLPEARLTKEAKTVLTQIHSRS